MDADKKSHMVNIYVLLKLNIYLRLKGPMKETLDSHLRVPQMQESEYETSGPVYLSQERRSVRLTSSSLVERLHLGSAQILPTLTTIKLYSMNNCK